MLLAALLLLLLLLFSHCTTGNAYSTRRGVRNIAAAAGESSHKKTKCTSCGKSCERKEKHSFSFMFDSLNYISM